MAVSEEAGGGWRGGRGSYCNNHKVMTFVSSSVNFFLSDVVVAFFKKMHVM